MPTNWKKNNPGLVSLSCWLAAPSHCGGCSCLLDRDLALCSLPSHPELACVNPPPSAQLWGERVLEPSVEELEGRTDRATKRLWPTTNSVPITVLPNHAGDPLLIPGKEVKELSLTRQLFPQMLSPASCQPVPSAASLYHFIPTLCLQSNQLPLLQPFHVLPFLHLLPQFWEPYIFKKWMC